MKTTRIVAVIGICEGYGHNNESDACFQDLYMGIAKEVYEETGIYVSAVCKKAEVVYNRDWGCPKGGEDVYEVSATANPEFVKNIAEWQNAAIKVIKKLKAALKQSTVTVEISEVDLLYIK